MKARSPFTIGLMLVLALLPALAAGLQAARNEAPTGAVLGELWRTELQRTSVAPVIAGSDAEALQRQRAIETAKLRAELEMLRAQREPGRGSADALHATIQRLEELAAERGSPTVDTQEERR